MLLERPLMVQVTVSGYELLVKKGGLETKAGRVTAYRQREDQCEVEWKMNWRSEIEAENTDLSQFLILDKVPSLLIIIGPRLSSTKVWPNTSCCFICEYVSSVGAGKAKNSSLRSSVSGTLSEVYLLSSRGLEFWRTTDLRSSNRRRWLEIVSMPRQGHKNSVHVVSSQEE